MSERLGQIEARIASIGDLHEIVTAMRVLAAVRAQQAAGKLDGIRAYSTVIADALSRVLALMPDDTGNAPGAPDNASSSAALLLFTGEHGFSGNYNERLIDFASQPSMAGRLLFIAGTRGLLLATERRLEVSWSTAMATQVSAIGKLARDIATEIYRRFSAGDLYDVDVVYARDRPSGEIQIVHRSLLPLDLSLFRHGTSIQPPLINLDPQALVDSLVGDYVQAELARAAMECLASDNTARMRTMQSARRNIEDMLGDLRSQARQTRQADITAEILELVTGAKATLRARA